jgi:hypothetical protein
MGRFPRRKRAMQSVTKSGKERQQGETTTVIQLMATALLVATAIVFVLLHVRFLTQWLRQQAHLWTIIAATIAAK